MTNRRAHYIMFTLDNYGGVSMRAEKVSELLIFFKTHVPENRISDLEYYFLRVDDEYFPFIKSIKLKSPSMALWLSILGGFCGCDRFYIKDTVTGVQKLLFNWLTLGVWHFVDIFITYRLCKEENYLTIFENIRELIN